MEKLRINDNLNHLCVYSSQLLYYFLVSVIKADYNNLLVCWVCKLIMEGGPEELDEHMAKDHEFDDAPIRYLYFINISRIKNLLKFIVISVKMERS